jgi:hypothetical protein
VSVEGVSWDKDGDEPTDDYTPSCGSGNANHHVGTGFFVHKGTRFAVIEGIIY